LISIILVGTNETKNSLNDEDPTSCQGVFVYETPTMTTLNMLKYTDALQVQNGPCDCMLFLFFFIARSLLELELYALTRLGDLFECVFCGFVCVYRFRWYSGVALCYWRVLYKQKVQKDVSSFTSPFLPSFLPFYKRFFSFRISISIEFSS
jgi:hypothetical protein